MGVDRTVKLNEGGAVSDRRKDRILYPVMLFGLLFILSFLLSPYSPMYRYLYDPDAICYRTMARGLLEGKVPYRDLFDHKGPLVYYIFSLGYLISGVADWGAWIVIWLFNSFAYFFCYRTMRVFRNADHSFLATLLVIFISGFSLYDIFATMSKPDNLVLLPLFLSVFLFVKETFVGEGKAFQCIRRRSMFLIGLLCGTVFMIKLNVCLFYLAFIGFYLLWLLIRKNIKELFASTGLFLSGIVTACLPVLLSLLLLGNLKEFYETYIVFNIRYASVTDSVFYLSKTVISNQVKNRLSIFLLLTVLALFRDIRKKQLNATRVILLSLSAFVMIFLTASYVFGYFYIVFAPFYLYGTDFLSDVILKKMKTAKMKVLVPILISILLAVLVGLQTMLSPFVPREKTDAEKKIEEYASLVPDARVLYLEDLCEPMYSSYLTVTPDFRVFYTPPVKNSDLFAEQVALIRAQKTEVVVFSLSSDNERNDSIRNLLETSGYEEYQTYDDGSGYIYYSMYVLKR